jgi:hypothetical protein
VTLGYGEWPLLTTTRRPIYFPARSKTGRRPVGYRRLGTAAEAIRFAVEQMPFELLDGTILEIESVRVDGAGIRVLYESVDYQLVKASR